MDQLPQGRLLAGPPCAQDAVLGGDPSKTLLRLRSRMGESNSRLQLGRLAHGLYANPASPHRAGGGILCLLPKQQGRGDLNPHHPARQAGVVPFNYGPTTLPGLVPSRERGGIRTRVHGVADHCLNHLGHALTIAPTGRRAGGQARIRTWGVSRKATGVTARPLRPLGHLPMCCLGGPRRSCDGAGDRLRTCDPLLTRQQLFQLSYSGTSRAPRCGRGHQLLLLVDPGRLELPALSLQSCRAPNCATDPRGLRRPHRRHDDGAGGRNRTGDVSLTKRALYRLSHSGTPGRAGHPHPYAPLRRGTRDRVRTDDLPVMSRGLYRLSYPGAHQPGLAGRRKALRHRTGGASAPGRTGDARIFSPALYHLSYAGVHPHHRTSRPRLNSNRVHPRSIPILRLGPSSSSTAGSCGTRRQQVYRTRTQTRVPHDTPRHRTDTIHAEMLAVKFRPKVDTAGSGG